MPPWTLTRRQLLAGGLVGGAGVAAAALGIERLSAGQPSGGSGPAGSATTDPSGPSGPSAVAPAAADGARTLVLVALYGGNDGLNTVVPASDPAYAKARPTLGYQAHEVLPLGDGLGLNPRLTRLAGLWKRGQLAVVLGVGYPDPNLSHFDSMDIWQTANVTSGDGPGWVGTWLDGHDQDPLSAVSIGPTVPTTVRGRQTTAAALVAPRITLPGPAVEQAAYSSLVAGRSGRSGWAAAVAGAGAELLSTRTELAGLDGRTATAKSAGTASASTAGSSGGNAGTSLSDQLAVVAALIHDGAPTRVFHVSVSSYDTHADEKATHEAKLAELDAGIGSFFDALGGSSRAAGTVVATYSEFGRRPAENASGGTDHGTAAPLFVAGPGVRGGMFFGTQPSLTKLDANGNLIHTIDFRTVYASLLDQVIGASPASVLGARFPTLDLLR